MSENEQTEVDVQNILEEQLKKIMEVDDETLKVRVLFIQNKLKDYISNLRNNLDESKASEELLEQENFRKWYIASEIMKQSEESGDAFNRLLYFMFEQCNKNISTLLSFYDLEFEKSAEGNIEKINLVMLEE